MFCTTEGVSEMVVPKLMSVMIRYMNVIEWYVSGKKMMQLQSLS